MVLKGLLVTTEAQVAAIQFSERSHPQEAEVVLVGHRIKPGTRVALVVGLTATSQQRVSETPQAAPELRDRAAQEVVGLRIIRPIQAPEEVEAQVVLGVMLQ